MADSATYAAAVGARIAIAWRTSRTSHLLEGKELALDPAWFGTARHARSGSGVERLIYAYLSIAGMAPRAALFAGCWRDCASPIVQPANLLSPVFSEKTCSNAARGHKAFRDIRSCLWVNSLEKCNHGPPAVGGQLDRDIDILNMIGLSFRRAGSGPIPESCRRPSARSCAAIVRLFDS